MNTQRDELARKLDEWLDDEAPLNLHRYLPVADAILAAGYSKPRVIETIEELDTLCFQAVVIDSYGTPYVCERHATNGTRNEWQQAGTSYLAESDEISLNGPFTVAYQGTR